MMTQKICKLVRLTFISISSQNKLQFQKEKKMKQQEIISLVYQKKKSINEKKSLRTKKKSTKKS